MFSCQPANAVEAGSAAAMPAARILVSLPAGLPCGGLRVVAGVRLWFRPAIFNIGANAPFVLRPRFRVSQRADSAGAARSRTPRLLFKARAIRSHSPPVA